MQEANDASYALVGLALTGALQRMPISEKKHKAQFESASRRGNQSYRVLDGGMLPFLGRFQYVGECHEGRVAKTAMKIVKKCK